MLTIFLLQSPEPDVAIFKELATISTFADPGRPFTSFERVPIRWEDRQASPEWSRKFGKRVQIESVVCSTQNRYDRNRAYQRNCRHTGAVALERVVSSRRR